MNILVIMTDQQRFDALGFLGNALARTPNLDRLRSESVHFENCFTQSPACKPARHSLATGRYVHAHGVLKNGQVPYPGMVTIAHALEPLGYRRFHLGHMHWSATYKHHGYEGKISELMWRDTLPPEAVEQWEWECDPRRKTTTAGPSTRTKEQFWGHHVATNAIRLIEEAASAKQPFLSWVSFHEPHPPFYPPAEIYQRIDAARIRLPDRAPPDALEAHPRVRRQEEKWRHMTDAERRRMIVGYYGLVTLVDEYIGMVLGAVDRLGLREETAIIFTSDHGEQLGEHGMFMKFNMREGSVHVPLMISVPRCGPGSRRELVEHVDLFRTICDLSGATCPDSVQGRSLAPSLRDGRTPAQWRDAVFSQYGDVHMVRTAKWKLNIYDGVAGELFDLEKDPREFYNQIEDPATAVVVEDLKRRFESWKRDTAPAERQARAPIAG